MLTSPPLQCGYAQPAFHWLCSEPILRSPLHFFISRYLSLLVPVLYFRYYKVATSPPPNSHYLSLLASWMYIRAALLFFVSATLLVAIGFLDVHPAALQFCVCYIACCYCLPGCTSRQRFSSLFFPLHYLSLWASRMCFIQHST